MLGLGEKRENEAGGVDACGAGGGDDADDGDDGDDGEDGEEGDDGDDGEEGDDGNARCNRLCSVRQAVRTHLADAVSQAESRLHALKELETLLDTSANDDVAVLENIRDRVTMLPELMDAEHSDVDSKDPSIHTIRVRVPAPLVFSGLELELKRKPETVLAPVVEPRKRRAGKKVRAKPALITTRAPVSTEKHTADATENGMRQLATRSNSAVAQQGTH
jgi:hypothetical protein